MCATPATISFVKPVEQRLCFERLCELEPRLLDLFNEAKAVKDNKRRRSFCANAVWYGRGGYDGLKHKLHYLVGWSVKRRGGDPRLASSLAYDIAYRNVYDALPACRNCVCWGFQDAVDQRLSREPN